MKYIPKIVLTVVSLLFLVVSYLAPVKGYYGISENGMLVAMLAAVLSTLVAFALLAVSERKIVFVIIPMIVVVLTMLRFVQIISDLYYCYEQLFEYAGTVSLEPVAGVRTERTQQSQAVISDGLNGCRKLG